MAKPVCGHFQNFPLVRFASGAGYRFSAHEHGDVPNEPARPRSPEDLFLSVTRLEHLQLTSQNNSQAQIAPPGPVYQLPAPDNAARAKGLQHRQLPIIKLREGYTLRIAIELLVLNFSHGLIG